MAMRAIDGADHEQREAALRETPGAPLRGPAGRDGSRVSHGDQKVSSADCMSVCAFFSASSGDVCPASAALTFS